MSGLLRWWACCVGGVLVLLLASHCGDDVRIEPPTQITARVRVDASLQYQKLFVQSASAAGSQWQVVSTQTFAASELQSTRVIDLVFVPKAGTARDKQIELVIEAQNAAGTALAQERALVSFVPTQQKLLELWLGPCGGTAVCQQTPNCHGTACLACTDGQQCGSVRRYDGSSLPAFEPAETPDPNKPRTGGGNSSAVTCASESSSIVCDDGNACNGRETCSPGSAGALANGCALESQPVTCTAGSTCVKETGACASCSERSDGDGDKAASTACDGNDCDDSDATVAPGLAEKCDGKDNDCNGTKDDPAAADKDCQDAAPMGVTATCVRGACQQTQKVELKFKAVVGNLGFACNRDFSLGSPARDVQPQDFRFFVQGLALINGKGESVPVTLTPVAGFQTAQVALVDFGGPGCRTTMAHTTVTGTVPAGTYEAVEFVNGVPDMPMGATAAPFTNEGVARTGGFRYVLAAVRSGGGTAPADGGTPDGGVPDAGAPGDAGTATGTTTAVYLNERNVVRINAFDPAKDTIAANFAPIFAGVDVSTPSTCEAAAMCTMSYAALGVGGPPAPVQSVFSKD